MKIFNYILPLIALNCYSASQISYSALGDRSEVLNLLKTRKFKRVLDIGYSANTWSKEFVTHYIDVNLSDDATKKFFLGDVNFPEVWEKIKNDVETNGPFDFCICSHTLEDIINPVYVADNLKKYAKAGFIAVPSKYLEMNKVEGPYRGYIHHRYIFNSENGKMIGYPKLNFLEWDERCEKLTKQLTSTNSELQLSWEGGFDLEIINDNYMGPDVFSVIKYYQPLFNNN